MKRIISLLLLLTPASAIAQTQAVDARTDAELIADAVRAGPVFVTKGATIVDWPKTKKGEWRVLRSGTNGWTCIPGLGSGHQDEPGCYDSTFMQWIKDTLADKKPHIDRIGISYMYGGKWLPNKSHPGQGEDGEFHVGPHIMIVPPDQRELSLMSLDGSNGQPYVNSIPGHKGAYLVIPIKQWGDPYVTKLSDK